MLHIPVLHQKATSQVPQGGFEEHTEKLSFHSLGFYCRTSFNRGLQINGRQEAKYISVPMQPTAIRSRQPAQVLGAVRPLQIDCRGCFCLTQVRTFAPHPGGNW